MNDSQWRQILAASSGIALDNLNVSEEQIEGDLYRIGDSAYASIDFVRSNDEGLMASVFFWSPLLSRVIAANFRRRQMTDEASSEEPPEVLRLRPDAIAYKQIVTLGHSGRFGRCREHLFHDRHRDVLFKVVDVEKIGFFFDPENLDVPALVCVDLRSSKWAIA